ncbi:MAG: SDR family oxidoreductase [bacterium]|nr:SDR family oxidoreductase [bacterium]
MKYVVTGAAGFIGSHLVESILTNGDSVVALDNLFAGKRENLSFVDGMNVGDRFTFVEGDIRDLDTCRKVCEDADFVLHEAALGSVPRSMEMPDSYHDNNVTGVHNMLLAARDAGIKRFVFASSSSVYGGTVGLPKVETMTPVPLSPYAAGKLLGEIYCKLFYDAFGLETVALRYFNVFGERQDPNSQYSAAIPKFVTAYLNNEAPLIHGDGEQTRDFTYVKNVVAANLNACVASSAACGQAINVGCGDQISINQLALGIGKTLGSNLGLEYGALRAGDVKHTRADVSRLKDLLGVGEFITLEEGLKHTVAFFKS